MKSKMFFSLGLHSRGGDGRFNFRYLRKSLLIATAVSPRPARAFASS